MASIVAYIELREGAVTRPSRSVLTEARRVADAAGATVYALLTVEPLAQTQIDRLAAEVSAAGADRILCSSAEALAGPSLDATHGQLLAQVAEHLRPLLFLLPAGGTGTELGPPLAVRIGAAYMANAGITIIAEERAPDPASQRVVLCRWRARRDGQRRIDLGDFERPVVASLACGLAPAALGEPYAEVEMLPFPESNHAGPQLVAKAVDSEAGYELGSALIWSAMPLDQAVASLLPAAAMRLVATAKSSPAIATASPSELFLLSPATSNEPPLSILAPGAIVSRIRTNPEVPS